LHTEFFDVTKVREILNSEYGIGVYPFKLAFSAPKPDGRH